MAPGAQAHAEQRVLLQAPGFHRLHLVHLHQIGRLVSGLGGAGRGARGPGGHGPVGGGQRSRAHGWRLALASPRPCVARRPLPVECPPAAAAAGAHFPLSPPRRAEPAPAPSPRWAGMPSTPRPPREPPPRRRPSPGATAAVHGSGSGGGERAAGPGRGAGPRDRGAGPGGRSSRSGAGRVAVSGCEVRAGSWLSVRTLQPQHF